MSSALKSPNRKGFFVFIISSSIEPVLVIIAWTSFLFTSSANNSRNPEETMFDVKLRKIVALSFFIFLITSTAFPRCDAPNPIFLY